VALNPASAARQLHHALQLLQQNPPAPLESEPASLILRWAIENWRPERLQHVRGIPATAWL